MGSRKENKGYWRSPYFAEGRKKKKKSCSMIPCGLYILWHITNALLVSFYGKQYCYDRDVEDCCPHLLIVMLPCYADFFTDKTYFSLPLRFWCLRDLKSPQSFVMVTNLFWSSPLKTKISLNSGVVVPGGSDASATDLEPKVSKKTWRLSFPMKQETVKYIKCK